MNAKQRKDKIIEKIIEIVVKNYDELKYYGTYFLNLNYKNIKNIQYSDHPYDENLGRGFWLYSIAQDRKRRNITTGWKENELEEFYQTILQGLKNRGVST